MFLLSNSSGFGADGISASGWPVSSPEAQGMNSEKLNDMLAETLGKKYHLDSLTIIRNGTMVLDVYFYPFKKDARHIIHSCTKSITSAAFGIAVDRGYIKDLDQPVYQIFPERKITGLDDAKKAITIKHLLTMTSGLQTDDSYIYRWRGLNEMVQADDWLQFVLDRPMAEHPGTRFEYSNCVTFLLSAIIQKTTGMNTFEFMQKYLFGPLDVSDVKWESSPNGISVGYGAMSMMPHDMAKIGWLYLNNGRWGDRQLVPEKWVTDSTRKHINATLFEGYGYQWWVTPGKYYAAVGYSGQFIFVVPDKNMVAVFTSVLDQVDFFIPDELLNRYVIPAVVDDNPLPENARQAVRLKGLIDKCGESRPYVWHTQADGVAVDSQFTRTADPAFRFTYPPGAFKLELDPTLSNQIMTMRTQDEIRFSAYIVDVANHIRLEHFGPNYYARLLGLNPKVSNLTVVSNRSIVLDDGTPAYRTDIKCRYGGSPTNLVLVAAKKQDRYVYVVAGAWGGRSLAGGAQIVESITFR
jgi:CubicO group peptidase (beta-lactamase class C family)